MTYLEKLKTEAEAKAIPALAGKVRQLAKEVSSIEDRILFERGDVDRREGNLTHFKESAASKLATSTSAYCEWQSRYKKLTADLAAARDALALLENVIAPKTKSALQVARGKLEQALTAVCLAVRPSCETKMAELLSVVVGECDEFLAACVRLHLDCDCTFTPPPFDGGPTATHPRLARCEKRTLTASAKSLSFVPPPATPAPQAAPVDVPDRQATPGATPTPAPDTGAVPDDAPAAAPGVETSAQDASGRTISDGADTQTAPEGDSEKKATRPPTILTGDVAGTAPDAPPDAGA